MKAGKLWVLRVFIMLAFGCVQNSALAVVSDCDGSQALEQSFASGAAWTLCVGVSDQHGLDVTSVHYRAPGDTLRSVMHSAHIGQILVHYHDETTPRAQIDPIKNNKLLRMSLLNCNGEQLLDSGNGSTLCSKIVDNRTQAKFAKRPSVQSRRWELSAVFQRDSLVWTTSISFDEDGRITPGLSLSGRARINANPDANGASAKLPDTSERLMRATILATWRLVFDLDDGEFDAIQQFDFPLSEQDGNRRAMQVKNLDEEGFIRVDRENFRGWRIVDTGAAGYLLNPSNSGFDFNGSGYNWAEYDLALTRFKPCERYALHNRFNVGQDTACGTSLDEFVNDEALLDAHPVLWFSQSRTFHPTIEDWPIISNFYQSFTLLPYDWTPASPFEVKQ